MEKPETPQDCDNRAQRKPRKSPVRSGRMPPAEFWVTAPDVRTMPMSKDGPLVNEGQRLPASVEVLTPDSRPMIWSDLPVFEAKYGRTASDMVYDLGYNPRAYYQHNVKTPLVLPFDMELLLRLYDRYPSSCEWATPDIRAVFEMIYGGIISSFPDELQDRARMAYGARFPKCLVALARSSIAGSTMPHPGAQALRAGSATSCRKSSRRSARANRPKRFLSRLL